MNIPSGNAVPVLNKNYKFIVDGVFFLKKSVYNSSYLSTTSANTDKQFIVVIDNTPLNTKQVGGTAESTQEFSKIKRTFNNGYGGYTYYINVLGQTPAIAFQSEINAQRGTLKHELCHLLTLDHTVKTANGCNCRCNNKPNPYPNGHACASYYNSGNADASCHDLADDTPLATEMVDNRNSPMHPGVNDPNAHPNFFQLFSNNQMEYTGYDALSKDQIDQIHNVLEGGMKSYLICGRLNINNTICDFNEYLTSFFGKNVIVNNICGNASMIQVKTRRYAKIFFDESFEVVSGMEVGDGSFFEVFKTCTCN